jgi:glucose/arabinose dehydrogenase
MAHITRPAFGSCWRSARGLAGALCCAAVAACGGGGGGSGSSSVPAIELEAAFDSLDLDVPVKLVQHPTDDDRWYVVQLDGLVVTFLASDPAGTLETAADVVVDGGVDLGSGGEQGLLGMAFDPDFDTSGEIYLTYTDDDANDSVLARWVSEDGGLTFLPDDEPVVLAIPHPESNHNGGDIAFGEDDYLYYSMGDGGGPGNDTDAQDTMSLLGKILRIDVNAAPPMDKTYAIPASNPFAANAQCDDGSGAAPCPEVFAWGLRNPWRMSFDLDTGALWAGDVGETRQEEIDLILRDRNYGWDCSEGTLEGPDLSAECAAVTAEPPRAVHGRDDAHAITGGVVYRGSEIPGLDGFYLYGDYITGRFFALDTSSSGRPPERISSFPALAVAAFGQGRDGEVYVVTHGSPSIYKVVAATP